MNKAQETSQKFEFLDNKYENKTFYKVLKHVEGNIYVNVSFDEKFKYTVGKEYTEPEAVLKNVLTGKGFYAFMDLCYCLNQWNVRSLIDHSFSVHRVHVKEICAESDTVVRARKIIIDNPLTSDGILQILTGKDGSKSEIIEEYTRLTREIKKFYSAKSYIESLERHNVEKEKEKHTKQYFDRYWTEYNKYTKLFSDIDGIYQIFSVFCLPYKKDNDRIVRPFNMVTESKLLDQLDLLLIWIKKIIFKGSKSIDRFINRLNNKLEKIKEKVTHEKEIFLALSEKHKDMLSSIDVSKKIVKVDRSEAKNISRKYYRFTFSHLELNKNTSLKEYHSDKI